MTPAEIQALKNYYRPLRTPAAKIRDALLHAQQSEMLIAERAKENQKSAGGANPVIQNSGKAVRTDKAIAKKAGVSRD